MGNTIRREPVNFSIPASPNYKFLNITNFRGLDVSSNPFELATNTASDCLNVYVDETNTLTTRPRLECKFEDLAKIESSGSYVNIYSLYFGYLIQVKEETGHVTWRVYNNKDHKIHNVSPVFDIYEDTFPEVKANVFEKDDKIYVLTSKNYFYIDISEEIDSFGAYKADWVEGYVPTTATVAIDGTKFEVEGINLLSDKYKEKYFWDGVYPPDIDKTYLSLTNDTYDIKTASDFGVGYINMIYDDETVVYYYSGTKYGKINRESNKIEYISDICPHEVKAISMYNKTLATSEIVEGTYHVKIYTNYNDNWVDTGVSINTNNNAFNVTMSSDGDAVFVITKNSSNEYQANLLTKNGDTTYNNKVLTPLDTMTSYDTDFIRVTSGYPHSILYGHPDVNGKINKIYKYTEDSSTTDTSFKEFYSPFPKINFFNITNYGELLYSVLENGDLFTIEDLDTTTAKYSSVGYPSWLYDKPSYIRISDDLKSVYFYNNSTGYVGYDYSKPKEANPLYLDIVPYIFIKNKYILEPFKDGKIAISHQTTPSFTAQYDITYNEEYSNWLDRRNNLFKSTLFTRFDNNYWFVSGNTYFRSQNNDPTYFPITEYSELGDSNEDITGFNIANDTTLLAYKPSRLYLIQPFYSETTGTTEYTKTESKNTVGNTAIDAPIVTTLTEIPIQINYDGIYGLSQVSNVSAVERIADLMSEPINDRWLNEDDEVIKKAQTLNRLYWTYIILPYEKLTKVYLLDNRTNSWYYWELPIKLLNAFAKDNRAEFVDADGNIYYLTTTDIRNMGFDTQLVTEYYDYGKKLIPWYWQSQVLYLGTMNYAKRLVNTTFILTDTDTQDGYGLQYSFKVFRKLASSVPEKELSGELNLVRSTTKKTNLSKFGFLQLKLSNITEESQGTEAEKAYRNNKLRLVGLGLKYVLLEGLIR